MGRASKSALLARGSRGPHGPAGSHRNAGILGEMRIYLDMCCLKRPFDDQSQPRIRLETEAVLSLLAAESATIEFIRSAALAEEVLV